LEPFSGVFEKEIDMVVHFAAETPKERMVQEPALLVETNIVGTQILLAAAKCYGVQKFIHVSSRTDSNHLFAATKASSDFLVRAYFETFGLPVSIVRASNTFGPYQNAYEFVPRSIIGALYRMPLTMAHGDVEQSSWVHVFDYCTAIDSRCIALSTDA